MKKFIPIKFLLLGLLFIIFCLTLSTAIYAAESSQVGVPFLGLPEQCLECGNCSACDIINAGINIGRFLIGIIGSIIFIYFIYGGIYFLTSHGNPNMVTKGKDILINSVIGLAIVMLTYVIVNFAVLAVTGSKVKSIKDFVTKNLTCPEPPQCPQ
jgi:hypothetical protein